MSVFFGGGDIWSDATDHHAKLTTEGYEVSWLPGRFLRHDQAITAMLIADTHAVNPPPDDNRWRCMPTWKDELGLTDSDRPA